jgi:hypothetical protein
VFDVYYAKDKILVLLQQVAQKPISFMIEGVSKPIKKKKKSKKPSNQKKLSPKTPTTNSPTTTS